MIKNQNVKTKTEKRKNNKKYKRILKAVNKNDAIKNGKNKKVKQK